MRVKALKSIYYNRRMRASGDVYDMDDREHSEAKILAALGKIEILPKDTAAPPPQPETTTIAPTYEAGNLAAVEAEDESSLTEPRRYRRRDMRAEK